MSLYLYECNSDVPKGIEIVINNEDYFNEHTINLLDTDADKILEYIDGGKYKDEGFWTDRFGGSLYWTDLSTGGKTALNIYYNPNVAFSVAECGKNAREVISTFGRGRTIGLPLRRIDGLDQCDVIDCQGDHYTSIQKYMEELYGE